MESTVAEQVRAWPKDGLQELVSIKTLAQMLELPEKTVRQWVWKRQIPYHKLGKLVRFHIGEIRAWYKARKIEVVMPDIIRERVV